MGVKRWLDSKFATFFAPWRLWNTLRDGLSLDELARELRRGYGGTSASGITVTPDRAAGLAAYAACVRVLSNDLAQLPLSLMRQRGSLRMPATDQRLYTVLHDRPNQWQTSFQFRKLLMHDLLFRGRGIALKVNGLGGPQALLRIHPDFVKVEQDLTTLDVIYTIRSLSGQLVEFQREDILHLWLDSDNGFDGISPIQAYRETIGDGLAIRQHGSRFFANAARISGVLESPDNVKLSAQAITAIRKDFEELYAGNENAFRTAVLPGGLKFTKTSIDMREAQWIEGRQINAREICGIFGVPPHKIGDLADATFSNVESENVSYVVNGLMPWIVAWEQSLNRDLLGNNPTLYFKFNVDGLLRGDAKSRAEALQIQRRSGVINANEWRELEDRNPRVDPGGEEYVVEANMRTQDGTPYAPSSATATPAPAAKIPKNGKEPLSPEQREELLGPLANVHGMNGGADA